jgi:hypothetical protein
MNKQNESAANKAKKPAWQRFLESPGGAAMITVILGGILGQWINLSIQESVKERNFQQDWLKARGDQALEAYKEYLAQEKDLIQRVYKLIGQSVSATEDLLILSTPEFSPGSHAGIEGQRKTIREQYNKIDAQWRAECEEVGLLMSYYHRDHPDVAGAWEHVRTSITGFMDCARKWDIQRSQFPDSAEVCRKEIETLKKAIQKLSASLESARQYAWEGWESPEKMRSALEKGK